jgi:hypothetical protein
MILTHESGSQEDQFDEKNRGKKSRDTIPFAEGITLCLAICQAFLGTSLFRSF